MEIAFDPEPPLVLHFGWTQTIVWSFILLISSCHSLGWSWRVSLSGIVVCRLHDRARDNVSDIDQCTMAALVTYIGKKCQVGSRKSALIREDISFFKNYIYIQQNFLTLVRHNYLILL